MPTLTPEPPVTRLTDNDVEDDDPDWSPDGGRIAFSSYRDGNREIYVMNSDGSGVTRLTDRFLWSTKWRRGTLDYADEPDWSPDGRRIAFRSHSASIFTKPKPR